MNESEKAKFWKEIQVRLPKLQDESREEWKLRKNQAKDQRNLHHKKINECFLNSNQVRNAKTLVEVKMESLSRELDRKIIVLFGSRSYSELMPIESIWMWVKEFVKKLKPNGADEVRKCLGYAMHLVNIHREFAWRCMFVHRESYRKHGHNEFKYRKAIEKDLEKHVHSTQYNAR